MGKREELIEAAAQAICEAEAPLCYDTTWQGVCEAPALKATYISKGAAALDTILAGLKMPSEEMLEAGADEEGSFSRLEARRVSHEVWQAMLSTLEETKP